MSLHAAGAFAPAVYFLAALVVLSGWIASPRVVVRIAEVAALLALTAAVLCAAALVSGGGAGVTELFGIGIWADPVGVTMLVLVTFIGWVVLRYAATYLSGERDERKFHGWMLATLGAVAALVASPSIIQLVAAWIATSLFLHQLLLFYADRPTARRAARKKFILARLADVALVGALGCAFVASGTVLIPDILEAARNGASRPAIQSAVVLLSVAAILKSAQFPFHGWLTEVMETPTPVSALLHAGIVNAGGFLLIRFADLMVTAPLVLALLVLVGGFTAILGSLAMLTQPAIKTSLAWSTIAQMGFMLLQCGLALFPIALLHIVAHSLYKAHAFLSAGGGITNVQADRRLGPVAVPSFGAVLRAFGLALAIYMAVGFAFGLDGKSPQAIVLGAILIFGIAYLIAQGLADLAPRALAVRTIVSAIAASVAYFLLQRCAEYLVGGAVPRPPVPGPLEWALLVLATTSFGGIALVQAMFPVWSRHPALIGLRIHLANGFYANALFDRMTGGWRRPQHAIPSEEKVP